MKDEHYGYAPLFYFVLSVANFILVAIEILIWESMGWAILQSLCGVACLYMAQYASTHYPANDED
jgi:hypothetical protein